MLYQKRTFTQIFLEGVSVYKNHFWTLTKPYIFPIVLQVIGILVWILLSYESVEWTSNFPVWVRWTLFAGANLLGMAMFMRGFWDYLVWFCALNLVVRDVYEGNPVLDSDAYTLRVTNRSMDYSLVWIFLFALFFVPIGLAVIPAVVGGANPELMNVSLLASGIIFVVGLVIASVLTLFCALSFQLFVFQPASAGATLFRSADLVRLKVLKVFAVSLVSFIVTQNILPILVNTSFDLLQLTNIVATVGLKPLSVALQHSAENALALQEQYPTYLISLYQFILAHPTELMVEITRCAIYTISAALVIPLGTCWFTLLYGDLKACKDEEMPGQAVFVSSAGQTVSTSE